MYSRYVSLVKSHENKFDPRKIRCHFRIQTEIDKTMSEAKKILAEEKELSAVDYAEIGIAFLEYGDWVSVENYATQALLIEENKPEDLRDKETLGTIHYLLATVKKETSNEDEALREYTEAYKTVESSWLNCNILENVGLICMRLGGYAQAAQVFEKVIKFASSPEAKAPIRNSLPAIKSYYGLAIVRGAIEAGGCPGFGLSIMEEATQLYQKMFREQNISEFEQSNSHDWQTHQFHLGVIACVDAERPSNRTDEENDALFAQAENYLQSALTGRTQNNAGASQIGDVYYWLGRTAFGINKHATAISHTERALMHYQSVVSDSKNERTPIHILQAHELIRIVKAAEAAEVAEAVATNQKIPGFLQFLSGCCPCTSEEMAQDIYKPSKKIN